MPRTCDHVFYFEAARCFRRIVGLPGTKRFLFLPVGIARGAAVAKGGAAVAKKDARRRVSCRCWHAYHIGNNLREVPYVVDCLSMRAAATRSAQGAALTYAGGEGEGRCGDRCCPCTCQHHHAALAAAGDRPASGHHAALAAAGDRPPKACRADGADAATATPISCVGLRQGRDRAGAGAGAVSTDKRNNVVHDCLGDEPGCQQVRRFAVLHQCLTTARLHIYSVQLYVADTKTGNCRSHTSTLRMGCRHTKKKEQLAVAHLRTAPLLRRRAASPIWQQREDAMVNVRDYIDRLRVWQWQWAS